VLEVLQDALVEVDDLGVAECGNPVEHGLDASFIAELEVACDYPPVVRYETVRVAGEFAEKHRERIMLLERKLAVQHDEIGLAEQDLVELKRRFDMATKGLEDDGSLSSVKQAWRELESAGGQRPETDLEGELLQSQMDRQAREAAVEQQLAHLKRKLGRDD